MVQLLQRFSFFLLVCVASGLVPDLAAAQDDSVAVSDTVGAGGTLRPRRGNYIVETFPSPARWGQTIVIQYYNHNDQDLAVDIVDLNGRVVYTVKDRQLLPNGLHRFELASNKLSSGVYNIRLRTYTPAGKLDDVQNHRFVIAR